MSTLSAPPPSTRGISRTTVTYSRARSYRMTRYVPPEWTPQASSTPCQAQVEYRGHPPTDRSCLCERMLGRGAGVVSWSSVLDLLMPS
jgi:hypothetical protein